MNPPLVSAIFLNYNGKEKLGDILIRCLRSILRSDYPNLEVIFFDNGSTDSSVEIVKQEFQSDDNLRIISISNNIGPNRAYNMALKYAKGEYLIILNNDVELEAGSIRELVNVMESDYTIGIANGKIMRFDHRHIQTVGGLMDLTFSKFDVGYDKLDQGQYDSAFEPTYPCGACMILRKSMIAKIGLFDPNYFFYHDDTDLGTRAMIAGYKVVYAPSSVAYHKEGGTVQNYSKTSILSFYLLNSRVGLFIKNLEFKTILKNLIPMFLSYVLNVFYMIKNGGAIFAFKSFFWNLGNFRNDWKRRLFIQRRLRRISDGDLLEHFLDYTIFLSEIMPRPLKWLLGNQSNFAKSVNQLTDDYYREKAIIVQK
jgi:GT2 family glycosyltransferase